MIERDEADEFLPEAHDPLGVAISQLLACIFEALPDCPERRAALVTTIEAHSRIAALLNPRQRLN